MTRVALITGITGQDGSYLAELLLARGYEVHGLIRRASTFNTHRIDHLYRDRHESGVRLRLHHGDLTDGGGVARLIARVRPDEVYNLAAQSHVRVSFQLPEYTAQVDAVGALQVFEAVAASGVPARVYQASSSEMFGGGDGPLSETSPFRPRSPYAAAKLFAHWSAINYRESRGLFACCGILFNHESPRRGETFVTRKIARAAAMIRAGRQDKLYLGNLDARRDWGYAPEYVDAMWRMLQRDEPDDFVIATGQTRTVREFAERAFALADLPIVWDGSGADERGVCRRTGRTLLAIDPDYYRPTEVDALCGDASKARGVLGWAPQTGFDELVAIMIEHEVAAVGAAPGASR